MNKMMEYYLLLANNLRLAAKLRPSTDVTREYLNDAADAIEDLVKRVTSSDEVLERASLRLKDLNQHIRDAFEANEEIRNG